MSPMTLSPGLTVIMTAAEIEGLIGQRIPGCQVSVNDPMNDGQHFEAVVVADQFEGISLVKQHQMVMNCLKEELQGAVHALALKTYTPQKWNESRSGN